MFFSPHRKLFPLLIAIALSGCMVGPTYQRPALTVPPTWNAPLPHQGDTAKLKDWWASWGDSTLMELIDRAQRENSSVTAAVARIAQARAAVTSVSSPMFPSATSNTVANRAASNGGAFGGTGGGNSSGSIITSTRSTSLDAAWELDLFGGNRRAQEAAVARADARTLDWHDARVSVAAEVATAYANLRACEILLTGYELDAASRAETSRLTNLKMKAGFTAPADAALSKASAAEAAGRLTQQRAECNVEIKGLSFITATPEIELRTKLASGKATFPTPKALAIDRVPASALLQRPDLAAAERELAAAASDIRVAQADRLPRISLSGSIGYSANNFGGGDISSRTWSFGPAISIPIFDAGRRAANADAAQARYQEILATSKGRVGRAVREVEEALVRIVSATNREADAANAVRGYQAFLTAAEARNKAGAGSQVELEDARRAVVGAQGVAVNVTREQLTSWISLYRAMGGGWSSDATTSQ